MGVIHYNQAQAQSPPSKLNPNAPIFIPMKSYLTVEDFSDEWWDLVHSSPFFRDYWLQDCYDDDSTPTFPDDDDFALPDFDDFFDSYLPANQQPQEVEAEKEKIEKELISLAALKWSKSSAKAEPRSFEKVPKIVKNNVRVNPRTIHQPRDDLFSPEAFFNLQYKTMAKATVAYTYTASQGMSRVNGFYTGIVPCNGVKEKLENSTHVYLIGTGSRCNTIRMKVNASWNLSLKSAASWVVYDPDELIIYGGGSSSWSESALQTEAKGIREVLRWASANGFLH